MSRSKRKIHSRGRDTSAVPARRDVLAFLTAAGRPRNLEHIAAELGAESDAARGALQKLLQDMVKDGQLLINRREGYGLVERMDMVVGRVHGHPDGFGFLIPDGGGNDLFLSAAEMRSLMHGDRVVARVAGMDRRGRPEGSIVEILERANHRVVGRFFLEGPVGFVAPDNRRLHQNVLIPPESRAGARTGQFVVAEIVTQPTRHTQPVGRIAEIIGEHSAPGMASEIAIRAFELPCEWPVDLQAEAEAIDPHAPLPLQGRRDLRRMPFVTIDGEDARDYDDAVCCERHGRGWRLWVAIADVSHYVRPGTALDAEAQLRGNSVYFPDRVIPMLPEVLSTHLCSLVPQQDRLAFVCEMQVSAAGNVTQAAFHDAVIRSAARLTYTQVAAAVVERDPVTRSTIGALAANLDLLHELYNLMNRRRREHALLEFRSQEARVLFGADGRVLEIREVVRNDAHRLIEEFMLAANVATAGRLLEAAAPAVYRNHGTPDPDKVKELRKLLGERGLTLSGGEQPATRDFARLGTRLAGREDGRMIETLMLRTLPLAVYGVENIGHFGLAFPAYTHFTSPIRRYPDLIVHRVLRSLGGRRRSEPPHDTEQLQRMAEHSSTTERRADEATRDAMQRLKCEFMESRAGETFDGIVTGVTGFGMFVEIKNILVEGLIHVTALPSDYYHFDAQRHLLRGERRGLAFQIGDSVRVRVMRVSVDEKKIDFELEGQGKTSEPHGRKGKKQRRRRR